LLLAIIGSIGPVPFPCFNRACRHFLKTSALQRKLTVRSDTGTTKVHWLNFSFDNLKTPSHTVNAVKKKHQSAPEIGPRLGGQAARSFAFLAAAGPSNSIAVAREGRDGTMPALGADRLEEFPPSVRRATQQPSLPPVSEFFEHERR